MNSTASFLADRTLRPHPKPLSLMERGLNSAFFPFALREKGAKGVESAVRLEAALPPLRKGDEGQTEPDTISQAVNDTRPLIETRALVKAYDVLVVLRKLDLAIPRGQFVALLGPNGSGKSTLLRLLSGLTRPTSGTILIGGWELPGEAAAVRAQIGMVSHKSLLYENLTARENLRFFARLYNLNTAALDDRIDALLKQVGLYRRGDSLVRTFSRGMQQRLSIARALLHGPDVLFMDEPYTGLDQEAGHTLDDLLHQAHADGHTIIMTTHELDRAARIASRVLILNRGSVGYDAPANDLTPGQLAAHYAELSSVAS